MMFLALPIAIKTSTVINAAVVSYKAYKVGKYVQKKVSK